MRFAGVKVMHVCTSADAASLSESVAVLRKGIGWVEVSVCTSKIHPRLLE